MFREFLLTLKRNKLAFILNIVGLSVAFSVLTIIGFQVNYELGYDRSYKDADRLYRLNICMKEYGTYFGICAPLAEQILESVPDIEAGAIVAYDGPKKMVVTNEKGDRQTFEEDYCIVSPDFFEVFSPRIKAGDPESCLENKQSAAIPVSMALRLFGEKTPLGKTFMADGKEATVTLIYEDFPKNSTMRNAVLRPVEEKVWWNWPYVFYMKLPAGIQPEEVVRKIAAIEFQGEKKEQLASIRYEIQSIKDLYFKGQGKGNVEKGNLNTTLSLSAIAVLILLVAYVNFINFSTALAPVRIRRMNTQQILGCTSGRLKRTIIAESAFVSLLAFGLSFVWTNLFISSPLIGFFNADLQWSSHLGLLAIIGSSAFALGLSAGIYPAFYMTSFQPALVLKGTFALTPKGVRLRNSLVVFQFICTVVLITVACFIKLQHNYMRNMDTGFERENVLYVPLKDNIRRQLDAFTRDLEACPEIREHTLTGYLPGQVGNWWGREVAGKEVNFAIWPVGHNFLRFFHIKIEEGMDFFEHSTKGMNKLIFNRQFLKKYDLDDILGKEVKCYDNKGQIVGIAADVNFNTVREKIGPMAFVCGDDQINNFILLKVSGNRLPETVAYIQNLGKQYAVEDFYVGFLDQFAARLYQQEEHFARLISVFGVVTILISLMGIYGLILFNARFRIKEIGIRKVNGATEVEMIALLNKGFLKLIVFAFVLAIPLAWYVVREWLSGFPYRIPVYWWVFLLAGVTTLLITVLTVSYQSWKAANTNPVEVLKNE
ncbi:ABC transporter permease [Odoribacter laneus]|jgi:efflux ABC transporter, permease protein|nr:ABC transporter permease [Odoribacter laneus]GKI20995.1 ABC transporter permease [Odoribacter laneus]GKI25577.1 ABC transporter permease [Odoribacter laneus]